LVGSIAILAAFFRPAGAGPNTVLEPESDVSATSPAFHALRRIQTRSAALFPGQAFPQSEPSLERYLAGKSVSSADSEQLGFALPGMRRELARWSDTARGHSLSLSPSVEMAWRGSAHEDSNDGSRLGGLGGFLYGRAAPWLSFYSHGMVYTEFTDKAQFTHQFNSDFGETYSVKKGAGDSLLPDRTFNRFEFYVIAEFSWITLKAGRDRIHTGPGYFSSLMASRDAPPYYLMEARINFAPWLTLDNYLLQMVDTRFEVRKYANLHRFEFKPLPGLSLAFQDIVIYQDRDPDWRYSLPLAPLTFTESDLGGPDNSAMAFDFLYAGTANFSLWGELFIDDLLSPTSFFDDFWENRWAGLTGFQVTSPFTGFDADLVVEYGHVEPWTYNGRKEHTSFKHFNVPSASRLGPDSRTIDARFAYRPTDWCELSERIEFSDKGLGRSGSLGVIHVDSIDGLEKEWLGGNTAARRIWRQAVALRYGRRLTGSFEWEMDFGNERTRRLSATLTATW
jgi:hypothetical protein